MNLFRNKIFNYLSLFMAFVYVLIGLYILKYHLISEKEPYLNYLTCLIFVLYGAFRGYRAFMCIREVNTINDQQRNA